MKDHVKGDGWYFSDDFGETWTRFGNLDILAEHMTSYGFQTVSGYRLLCIQWQREDLANGRKNTHKHTPLPNGFHFISGTQFDAEKQRPLA